ncbi:MAG: cysteine--tRNA ligase [Fibrobacteres bacterium]|nr:cysteine--tRNA ligase [Fibrobacterota bacterium]
MKLHFHNTLGRKLQEFESLEPGRVGMYCCGPTVYHYAHIGNLRTYVNEDFLRRALEYAGYAVNHVVNITDVGHLTSDADDGDDKMEKGAAREGRTVWEIAAHYTEAFLRDWQRLNLLQPTHWPKATDYIPQQISLVQELESRGYAYRTSDALYFDTEKFAAYGDFAGIKMDKLLAGVRVDLGDKKNPTDFALWKISPKDKRRAMEWESPWGVGFPGWHVECSAMSTALIGKTLDIHCGGTDHIRVHHTNEIAQSECAHDGVPFARFWLHNEFLKTEDSDKMSKSSGEFLTLQVLVDRGFHALDYRYFCATAHYRKFLTFSWPNLESARDAHRAFRRRTAPLVAAFQASQVPSATLPGDAKIWQDRFEEALGQDLNIPKALGVAQTLARETALTEALRGRLLLDWDRVLGLSLEVSLPEPEAEAVDDDEAARIDALVAARTVARESKNWPEADRIRKELADLKVVVTDTPTGPTWKKA